MDWAKRFNRSLTPADSIVANLGAVLARREHASLCCARVTLDASASGRSTSIRKATKHEARYYFSQILG